MAVRKLESPCRLCKGQSEITCLICGWKAPKKLKRQMTFLEQAEIDGEENRQKWIEQTYTQLKKYNMDSTGVESVDDMVREERGEWKDRGSNEEGKA